MKRNYKIVRMSTSNQDNPNGLAGVMAGKDDVAVFKHSFLSGARFDFRTARSPVAWASFDAQGRLTFSTVIRPGNAVVVAPPGTAMVVQGNESLHRVLSESENNGIKPVAVIENGILVVEISIGAPVKPAPPVSTPKKPITAAMVVGSITKQAKIADEPAKAVKGKPGPKPKKKAK